MENNETEQYELYEETKNDLILEEELDKTFTSPTMNSGIMEIYHNDPENIMHLVHCNQLHTNEILFFFYQDQLGLVNIEQIFFK